MAVDKFSISLPEELVADVDEVARLDGLTRSGVIREAMSAYVAERRSAQYEQARRSRVARAIESFDAIAAEWGADERSGADYLAELRGEKGTGKDSNRTEAPHHDS